MKGQNRYQALFVVLFRLSMVVHDSPSSKLWDITKHCIRGLLPRHSPRIDLVDADALTERWPIRACETYVIIYSASGTWPQGMIVGEDHGRSIQH